MLVGLQYKRPIYSVPGDLPLHCIWSLSASFGRSSNAECRVANCRRMDLNNLRVTP